MTIEVELNEHDIDLLNAYRVLSAYEHELDLVRFIESRDHNGNRYDLDLRLLLDKLCKAQKKVKKESNVPPPEPHA